MTTDSLCFYVPMCVHVRVCLYASFASYYSSSFVPILKVTWKVLLGFRRRVDKVDEGGRCGGV